MSDDPDHNFIRDGYTVMQGINGSFIVWEGTGLNMDAPFLFRRAIGFSNHIDLTRWLTDMHVVRAQSAKAGGAS
jgi:hypothetical protein